MALHTYTKKRSIQSFIFEKRFEGMQVFTLNDRSSSAQKVILYIHGGDWTKQPLPFHWKFMDKLAHLIKAEDLPQPKDIILLSAAVDLALNNPEIPEYEKKDPMLSSGGIGVIINRWAEDKQLTDPLISPIHSDFKGLGRISHFVGTHEGVYPDAMKLDERLTAQGVEIDTFVYPKIMRVLMATSVER